MNDFRTEAPIIGITSYLEQAQTGVWDVKASFLPQVYMNAVTDVGGTVVVLPPQPISHERARAIIARIDGLILSGGADVDPARYGEQPHEQTGTPRRDRDEFEAALIHAAIENSLPMLCVCRGAQMLNVELGGTLIQHLPDLVGDDRYQIGAGKFNKVTIEVEKGSQIAKVYGENLTTEAHLYHHQAIGEVGEGLQVTSRSDDGIIESIELPSHPFALGVQWHPEENVEDRRLFQGLIEAAHAHRNSREENA